MNKYSPIAILYRFDIIYIEFSNKSCQGEIKMEYKIKVQMRMSGEWLGYSTRQPLTTLDQANEIFNKFEYSSDLSNYQIVDAEGDVVRNWLSEQKWYQERMGK